MRKATVLFVFLAACALAQQHPRDKEIHDADTLAWWHTTEALSGDDMEGRDTGSTAYQRAAENVAGRFRVAGLQPAGDGGTYYQSVAMHEVEVAGDGTSFTVVRPERRYREWYKVRYHRPQDDLTQPVDFDAAAKFDQFFYKLTETVADSPDRPTFKPGSTFAPKVQPAKGE